MFLGSKDDPDLDFHSRHAPPGYKIAMQFFGGKTREQALRDAARDLGTKDLRIAPGHFDYGEDGDQEPTFRPFGWMVFVPEDW